MKKNVCKLDDCEVRRVTNFIDTVESVFGFFKGLGKLILFVGFCIGLISSALLIANNFVPEDQQMKSLFMIIMAVMFMAISAAFGIWMLLDYLFEA